MGVIFQEFDLDIRDKMGVNNLVVDHLSMIENNREEKLMGNPIDDSFSDESLYAIEMAKML